MKLAVLVQRLLLGRGAIECREGGRVACLPFACTVPRLCSLLSVGF